MDSAVRQPSKPWIRTPCLESATLSQEAGCRIFLKLDNLQPSGSFKSRGVGNLMLRATERAGPTTPIHFYCSSGGNAGLACATAAITLKRPATIVVPTSTSALMIGKLKTLGADVHQVGAHWQEADYFLREELLAKDQYGVYVPPFDHEDIWHGAASMIEEIDEQIGEYDAVVCSVGGGGLFNGVMEGLSKQKPHVKVLAVETQGADSLNSSIMKGEHVTLPAITSIASSLGATKVSLRTWQLAQQPNVSSLVVSDAEAVMGCVRFVDDERILVEPACGATIAPAYNGRLREKLGKDLNDEQWKSTRIVLIVCGGSAITMAILEGYRQKYHSAEGPSQKTSRINEENKYLVNEDKL